MSRSLSHESLCIVLEASSRSGLSGSAVKAYGMSSVASLLSGPKIPVPWTGVVSTTCCRGLRVNHGLFTQCTIKLGPEESSFCKTCAKGASENDGAPVYGTTDTRKACKGLYSVDVKGKTKTEVPYGKVVNKLKLNHDLVTATAAVQDWLEYCILEEPKKTKKTTTHSNVAVVESDEEELRHLCEERAAAEVLPEVLPEVKTQQEPEPAAPVEETSIEEAKHDPEPAKALSPEFDAEATLVEEAQVQAQAKQQQAQEPTVEEAQAQAQAKQEQEQDAPKDLIGSLVAMAKNSPPSRNDINKATVVVLKDWCASHAVSTGTKSEMQEGLRAKLGYVKLSAEELDAKKKAKNAEKAEKAAAAEQKKVEKAAAAEQKKAEKLAAAEQKKAEKLAAAEQKKAEHMASSSVPKVSDRVSLTSLTSVPIATELVELVEEAPVSEAPVSVEMERVVVGHMPVHAAVAAEEGEITQASSWTDESSGKSYMKDSEGYLFSVEHPHDQVGMYYQGRVWTDAELDALEAKRESEAVAAEAPLDE